MEHHDFYMRHGGGPGFFGWLLLFLVVALLVALIVHFATRLLGSHAGAPLPAARAGEDPLELLRLRYARGEIDRETFVQTNADLGGPAPPG